MSGLTLINIFAVLNSIIWGCSRYETYNMSEDWGRRYERLVEQGLAAIPGGFPAAHVEEIA